MVCMGEPSTEPAGLSAREARQAGGLVQHAPAAGTAWSWKQRGRFQALVRHQGAQRDRDVVG